MKKRIWILDFLRGIAILMVVAFHLVFDLSYFYDLPVSYSEGFWFYEGKLAAILFIGMVGVVSAIIHQEQTAKKALQINLKRGIRLLEIGLILTLITWIFFRQEAIWFGILHLMGMGILLTIPFLRFKWLNLALGMAVIGMEKLIENSGIGSYSLVPLGLPPSTFTSLDYYPLVPWLGVMLMGIGLGNLFYHSLTKIKEPSAWQKRLMILGKYSLWIYLLHQPILLGLLWVVF